MRKTLSNRDGVFLRWLSTSGGRVVAYPHTWDAILYKIDPPLARISLREVE